MVDLEFGVKDLPAGDTDDTIDELKKTTRSHDSKTKDEEKKNNSPPPSLSKLFSLGRPEMNMLIVALILMFGAEATGLLNPILISDAYDALIDPTLDDGQLQSDINRVMIMVLLVHFAGVAGGFLRAAIMGAAGERIVARLRNQLYSSILKQEIGFFDETKTGELVSRLSSDTTLVQQATSLAVPEVIIGIVKLIVSISLMFWLSTELAGVTLGFTILIFLVCAPFGKLIGELSKTYQNVLGEAQTRSTEALGAMRTVQSFASEDKERMRYAEKIGKPDDFNLWVPDSKETTYKVGFWKSVATSGFFTFIFGVGFGSMYFSLWYGFKLVNAGSMTLGDLTAFQSYIFTIGSSLAQTSRFITQVIEARGASGRIFELLERVPSIPSPPPTVPPPNESSEKTQSNTKKEQPITPPTMTGYVSFNEVSFSYPSRPDVPVLRNFTLEIPKNTTAALVGSSGAGKSTVVSLLQRFYDVTGGSISIDGNDIRDLDLKWLRSRIGYVQQEPQLFGLSVKENICYGLDREVSDEEIINVCKEANAHDFISAWPSGYDTLVGERGVKVSTNTIENRNVLHSLVY